MIFFEGARITLEAHIAEYPPEFHGELRKVLSMGDAWNPDRVIVLTSSTDTIDKHSRLRNRPYEPVDNTVRRFRLIDDEFRRLAPLYPNTVLINRNGVEFHDRAGLTAVIRQAGLPPFREVSYEQVDRFEVHPDWPGWIGDAPGEARRVQRRVSVARANPAAPYSGGTVEWGA